MHSLRRNHLGGANALPCACSRSLGRIIDVFSFWGCGSWFLARFHPYILGSCPYLHLYIPFLSIHPSQHRQTKHVPIYPRIYLHPPYEGGLTLGQGMNSEQSSGFA